MKKALGYIRVSSAKQVKGESLEVQQESIESYCKAFNIELVKVFKDAGISGRSIRKRIDLQNLLEYVKNKSIDLCIVPRLNRFGRNLRDTLNNVHFLEQSNCHLISLAENADFSNPYGKVMLAIMGSLAELQSEQQSEMVMASKIIRTKNGKPAVGRLPWGRYWDDKSETFKVDEQLKSKLEMVVEKYLQGGYLKRLAKHVMSYEVLLKNLQNRCADKWTVNFPSTGESFTFDVPELLDSKTIEAVKQKIELNKRKFRGESRRKFLLSNYLKCPYCGKSYVGQSRKLKNGIYAIYLHSTPRVTQPKCIPSVKTIKADILEYAVMQLVFETSFDEAGYRDAVKDAMPSQESIESMQQGLKDQKRELKQIDKQLENLLDLALKGALIDQIKQREEQLLELRAELESSILDTERKLSRLPTQDELEKDAECLKLKLQTHFASELHWNQMTWAESRKLVEFMFSGNGNGIFLRQCNDKSLINVEIVSHNLHGSVDLNRKCKLILNENNQLEPNRRLLTNDKSQNICQSAENISGPQRTRRAGRYGQ